MAHRYWFIEFERMLCWAYVAPSNRRKFQFVTKNRFAYAKSEDVDCTKEADRRKWDEEKKFDWMVRSIAN